MKHNQSRKKESSDRNMISVKIIVLIIALLIFAVMDGAFLGKLLYENKTPQDDLTTKNSTIVSQPIQDKGNSQKTSTGHDLEQPSMRQR